MSGTGSSTRGMGSPGVRQRGWYSDLSSGGAAAATGGPAASTVSKERRTPMAHTFRSRRAETTGQISRPLHEAADTQAIFQQPTMKKSLEPKVFVPHARQSGHAPRKVEVERKKRFFASQDIAQLLREQGVDFSLPGAGQPDTVAPGVSAVSLRAYDSSLPLAAFDDTDFEERTPEEWMKLGEEDGSQVGVPARALQLGEDGVGSWHPCTVTQWNPATALFTVRWAASDSDILGSFATGSGVESKGGDAGSAHLPRLHICFVSEDPFRFAARVGNAFRARRTAERRLRYNLYVECMPTDDMPGLDAEQVTRVLTAATASPALARASVDTTAILAEVNVEYQRTMNKIIFDVTMARQGSEGLLALVDMPPAAGASEPPPAQGTVVIPRHNFAETFSNFSFHSQLTIPDVIRALVKARGENLALEGDTFLSYTVSKPSRLDDFMNVQASTAGTFNATVGAWCNKVKNALKLHLDGLGKGDYNTNETSLEIYEFSKLKRLLTMVNFMMAADLRTLSQGVLAAYRDYIVSAVEGVVTVRGTADVEVDYSAAEDPISRPRRPPLFLVDLVVHSAKAPSAGAGGAGSKEAVEGGSSEEKSGVESDAEPAWPKSFKYGTPIGDFLAAPGSAFLSGLRAFKGVENIEKRVASKLPWSHVPVVPTVHESEEWVQEHLAAINAALAKAAPVMSAYLATFEAYLPFLNLDVDNLISKLAAAAKENFNLSGLVKLVEQHQAAALAIRRDILPTNNLGLFQVSAGDVSAMLAAKHTEIADRVLGVIADHVSSASLAVIKAFKSMDAALSIFPKDIEQLDEIRQFMATVPDKVKELQGSISDNEQAYKALARFNVQLPRDQFDLQWRAQGGPGDIAARCAAVAETLETEQARYQEEMESDQIEFEERLNTLHGEVLNLSTFTELDAVNAVAAHVAKLKAALEEAKESARRFNSREALFDKDLTEYDRINDIAKAFEPYCLLWETVHAWLQNKEEWHAAPFLSLDAAAIEKQHSDALKNMAKSVKNFEKLGVAPCLEIATEIRAQVQAFKPMIPVIQGLRNPGMEPRHWVGLSDAVGFHVQPEDSFTLQNVYELNLLEHTAVITKIGETAGKEHQIKVSLDEMEAQWADVTLVIEEYRNTKSYILKGFDELQALLDDHITRTAAMAFSAFKEHFAERIDKWQARLNTVTDVLDEWIKVQRSWLYLQPIFDSPDIQKQLPKEYKRFSTVDKNWRTTMLQALQNAKAIRFCDDPKLLEKFQESNTFLELVQKQLSDYLETKRAAFARFYFLSDDELLDILSSTKDPRAVQPHLKKCFEGVQHVSFTEDMTIVKFQSEEGELVDCVSPVDPRGKNVELWMGDLESMMRTSVKAVVWAAIAAYPAVERSDWIQEWPSQAVLNGSQLHWTQEVEAAIREGGTAGLSAYLEQSLAQIEQVVQLVRGELKPLVRKQIGALTVLDVHARDVIQRMIAAKVSATNDFDWISQMRYYWRNGEALEGDMRIQMLSSDRPYGYEYFGNQDRLVITPLTDKCYLTLMGAVQMFFGGAPAGPAGTGKTETVKDLAKALARQVVVFNCSDGLDFMAMAKFFKGLVSCGAWACFDEFNRIDVEVLSVVAQQIMTLQAGVRKGLSKMPFSGSEIKLDGNFAVFITMNPGYAGRTELPDNLKALFRPVAMMVPDYALIAEIKLFSFGFSNALSCARKMVATFRLCSEQLSSQSHYDYGMRAVMTVIRAAGNLKRADPDMNEEVLLYRALQDVNLPKFLAHDLPLFAGILSDLFPGVERPKIDYGDLMKALTYCTEAHGLQPVPSFLTKAIQLYETVVVRHGLMVVGPTGAGKSSIIAVLKDALTLMANKGRAGPKVERVQAHYLNPKSITMGQLYGMFDPNTKEWQDGILADMVRKCADSTTPDLKWMVFDGPVDAIWIENMNTVLDDNKKLCLVSGEIIRLAPPMEIMFEVEDLLVASPATVSRCGMVYMEPTSLGFDPLVQSWLEALPPCFTPSMKAALLFHCDAYLNGALFFLRKYLTEPVPTMDNSLVKGLLNILDCYFEPYAPKEGRDAPTPEAVQALEANIPALFMFALVWSVAATVDSEGRARLNAYLRNSMDTHAFANPFPDGGSVYDYVWDVETSEWTKWMATVPEYVFPSKFTFAELIVPTKDSVRYKFLGRTLLTNRKYVLMTGPTGTGKTVNMMEMLSKDMPSKQYIPINLTFSAQTSANQTQDIIDSKMEKRQRGTFGPTVGTYYVLFVDDLNMPQREKYFAQPPIELLRQWCDYGGWYDRKERSFRKIVDTILLAAMGPPGGGRNPITARMIRHFNVINYTPMDDESMFTIFSTILSNFLTKAGFDEATQALAGGISHATINMYNTAITSLKPTPSKPHYTFNLRDLGKVFQGLLMADARRIDSWAGFLRLWVHESRRVFADRLVSEADRTWFDDHLKEALVSHVGKSWDELDIGKRLLFGDYLRPGADPRVYEEARDVDRVIPIVQEYLNDHNVDSKSPMDLVLFMDAVENVSRIARVLRQPQGNCLLLGVGGSGRQSLARLATFMADYSLFQVEVSKGYGLNEWREDVKTCLMQAGVEQKQIVFLFTDTQITFEGMVEDINNVLNSGDVPNLYAEEDFEAIYSVCRRECQSRRIDATKINMFSQYLLRVRANIHVVMCMSPMGDAFRDRLRMFPALVNCCTINWFSDWPDEALESVAASSLSDAGLDLGDSMGACVQFFQGVHQGVADASVDFKEALRRYNYVTPTSYLELLSTFKRVLKDKREEVGTLRSRLQVGLDKLASTSEVVATLRAELQEKQPVLADTQVKVAAMIEQIDKDREVAAETKVQVEAEEAEASKMAAETKAIADDAQADLDRALPALAAATECVQKLKKKDIDEVRSFKNVVPAVAMTMHAACVMFQVPPVRVQDPENPSKKKSDYWAAARANLLADGNALLKEMLEYEKDDIKESIITQIEPFMDDPTFDPDNVKRSSTACHGICMWVRAMYTYHIISREVEPKRQRLREAQAKLDETMAKLAQAKGRLAEIEGKLSDLQAAFEAKNKQKDDLVHEVDQCEARLGRAGKLIGGLGGEKDRWESTVAKLGVDFDNLVGDALIASGTIAYLGAFTSDFRQRLVSHWQGELQRLQLPHTPGANVHSVLADPVQVRAWNIAGLPADSHSVENGIIMWKARRWPLLIDPQGQANRYIKNMGKDVENAPSGLEVLRTSEKRFTQNLESALRFGRWVLLENVGETIDASLEPVLLQQTFLQGGAAMIKLGETVIPYGDGFRFFMTTTLPNPHYPPEVCVKVSLLNFTITPSGLEDQMLGVFVVNEMPELEDRKNTLIMDMSRMKRELQDIENRILYLLSSSSSDNILDDEELIDTLAKSKVTSEDIKTQVAAAEETNTQIDATREQYRPVAFRASVLYFCIADLSGVDPMYQYSLQWFTNLFVNGIRNSEPADAIPDRITNLNDFFTALMYRNVCRSLFERHKLLFSFLMSVRIMQGDGKIDAGEWGFLIAGVGSRPVAPEDMPPNPDESWITAQMWSELVLASTLPAFTGLHEDVVANMAAYRAIFDGTQAHKVDLPAKWAGVTKLQHLVLLRCLRPDKITLAVQDFVVANLGAEFVDPPNFDLNACFEDSHVASPLIFVLSTGSDPTSSFYEYAEGIGMREKVDSISLGQGQGEAATALIERAKTEGRWVLLQNCHLASSWMTDLERLCEAIDPDQVSSDFRLWLTSMPSKSFPVSVLQNGVKMTMEPPKGLRKNMAGFFYGQTDESLSATNNPYAYRKLLFGLSFFHAIVQERKKFGPLGWNKPYEFNLSDLDISKRQLELYVDEYEEIPYQVLHFLTSYINYGGRVTDSVDLRLIDIIMRDYFCEDMLEDGYPLSPSGVYMSPPMDEETPQRSIMEYLDSLPRNPDPEVFGLHPNADITCDRNETFDMFDTLVSMAPRAAAGAGKAREEVIDELAADIFERLPTPFDVEAINMMYPVLYEESMNTVLVQECIRYNRLLEVMRSTLPELRRALKGEVVMSAELDAMGTAMLAQKIPAMWDAKAYPCLKPLGAWVTELLARLAFIQEWVDNGPPAVFWIGGFYFPQAFLTGTLQNYARREQFPIDTIEFNYHVVDTPWQELTEKPEDGCYIRGLYLEGARWNSDKHVLDDSIPKQLFTVLPAMHLEPAQFRKPPAKGVYRCPVYKILSRWGVLATTGHSSNFIMWVELPSDRGDVMNDVGKADSAAWIKAGVAAFTSLKY